MNGEETKINKKDSKGITLIALVVTIIVLLILAGVTISLVLQKNGVFEKAENAKEQTLIENYREHLLLMGGSVKIEKYTDNLTNKKVMDRYEEEIKNHEMFKKAEVIRKDEQTIRVITVEGHVFDVTEDGVEHIGKQGEQPPPDLEESDIESKITPSSWTKDNVTVEISTTISGYTLQYSKDGTTWLPYSQGITKEQNGAIYVRLKNSLNEIGGYTTINVANIDKLAPNNFTPSATSTTNSITLTGSTQDQAKTADNGSSGIEGYYFSKDNGQSWQQNSNKLQTSYTYTGLTQNQNYTLKMKAIDKAGNEIITNAITKNTGTVEGLDSSNVTFSYTPSTWTKGNVTVEISTIVSGYTLQYSKDGTTWSAYNTGITFTQNGSIYARLWDGTNAGGYATGNVTNIDKLTPNNFTPSATSTTNSITLTGSTQDQAKTADNGSSGIDKYYFSKDNGSTWEPREGQVQTSYTFSSLTQNQTYTLKMKAVDKAGNETITNAITKNTGTVEGLDSSNVTFSYTPSSWTKGNVTVEISTTISGYTLQYSKDGTTWSAYTTGIAFTQNGSIYARLWDGTNAGGYATGNVTNIDKLAPNTFTPSATSTTNSITLTGSTQDQAKTTENGSSGIEGYYFSKDNGQSWQQNSNKLQTSYTYTGLTQNQNYTLKMKAVDKAGNEIITNAITKNTGTVEGLDSSNVTFSYTPSSWTKGNVTVEISTTISGYTLQYSKDGTTWSSYTAGITFTQNGSIYARLWDGTNAGGYATGNVANIDKLAPNTFTPSATSTTNSITLTGSTQDQVKTADNGSSGIEGYYFSKDNGQSWQQNSNKLQTSYTFSGLTQNQIYTLKMKAVDKAGNETITNAITKNTGTVEGLDSSNVTFSYTPSSWTKGNVTVEISTMVSGYTLQYSKDGKTWSAYTAGITFTQNGSIYARLWDGTNAGGYATGNVANIDKLPPNTFTPSATSTTNSITLTGSTQDQAKTAENGSSGIKEYQFSVDNGATWQTNSDKLQTSYTYTSLTPNTSYTLKMKAIDNAGNEVITNAITQTTQTIPLEIEVTNLSGQNAYPVVLSIKATDVTGVQYLEMPDGTRVNGNGSTLTTTYNVTKNGPLTFKGVSTSGKEVSSNYEVSNVVEFITEWTFTENNTNFQFLSKASGVDVYVDWGDGHKENVVNQVLSHQYATSGVYDIKITGRIDSMSNAISTANKQYLTRIKQWGVLQTQSMYQTFDGCSNLAGGIPSPHPKTFEKTTSGDWLFYGCKNLTGSIPADFFANWSPQILSLQAVFSYCSGLTGSIPENLFANLTNISYLWSMFNGCSGLTGNIPENLFRYNTKLYSVSVGIGGTNITGSIPENLFRYNTELTSVEGAFEYADKLTGSIPTNLFKYNTKITDFGEVFSNCEGLTGSIPADLFRYNTQATSFQGTFWICRGLTGNIPANLFMYNTKATTFANVFDNCSNLTGAIPANLFRYNTQVTDFSYVFTGCKGLTSIPSSLFRYNTQVTTFQGTFGGTAISQIPSTLFQYNTEVTNFNDTFSYCNNLTSIPATLFDNCQKVTSFYGTFQWCENVTGNAPTLWTRTNVQRAWMCFYGCNKLSNYDSIPSNWIRPQY